MRGHLLPPAPQVPMVCQPRKCSWGAAGLGAAQGAPPAPCSSALSPGPWCVPRRDRNSPLPVLHNSLPTPLLPGHCIWSPGRPPPPLQPLGSGNCSSSSGNPAFLASDGAGRLGGWGESPPRVGDKGTPPAMGLVAGGWARGADRFWGGGESFLFCLAVLLAGTGPCHLLGLAQG